MSKGFISASYPGGEEALKEMIGPRACDGEVTVDFAITSSGQIADMKCIRAVGKINAAMGFGVLMKMPDWIPATMNGEAVNSRKRLTIYL